MFVRIIVLWPCPGGQLFYIGLYREILSETERPRALIFGMWHQLMDLYQVVFKLYTLGKKYPCPGEGGSNVLHRLTQGKQETNLLV